MHVNYKTKPSTFSSAITCVSLTQIGYKSIGKYVNAVCIMQTPMLDST